MSCKFQLDSQSNSVFQNDEHPCFPFNFISFQAGAHNLHTITFKLAVIYNVTVKHICAFHNTTDKSCSFLSQIKITDRQHGHVKQEKQIAPNTLAKVYYRCIHILLLHNLEGPPHVSYITHFWLLVETGRFHVL